MASYEPLINQIKKKYNRWFFLSLHIKLRALLQTELRRLYYQPESSQNWFFVIVQGYNFISFTLCSSITVGNFIRIFTKIVLPALCVLYSFVLLSLMTDKIENSQSLCTRKVNKGCQFHNLSRFTDINLS